MDEGDWLAERFQENRTHLRAVACRMLGSRNEADDAVQEAWLRLGRSDIGQVEDLGGWRRGGEILAHELPHGLGEIVSGPEVPAEEANLAMVPPTKPSTGRSFISPAS